MSRQYLRRLLVLVVEPVGVNGPFPDDARDDVVAEIVGGRARGVGRERVHQDLVVEDVDAHRCQHQVRRPRHRSRVGRLFLEPDDPPPVVHLEYAETPRLLDGDLDDGDRHRRAGLLVEADHLRVIHLVDMVAGQHDDVAGAFLDDRVEVLVDRVGRAEVPMLADPLLGRQDGHELAQFLRDDAPAGPNVAVERERLVLGRDEDAAQPRIDAVAEDEIDDPVRSAEVDGGLGAITGERIEPLAGASGQDNRERVGQHAASTPAVTRTARKANGPGPMISRDSGRIGAGGSGVALPPAGPREGPTSSTVRL